MNKQETAIILKTIKTAFPQFEITVEVTKLWYEMLHNISFQTAQQNLRTHLISNRFQPAIADIIRHDPEVFTDYRKMYLDTETYLQLREEQQKLAIDCPPQYSRKHLTSGGQEDV